jgi:DNA-binding response OmpR family regulator
VIETGRGTVLLVEDERGVRDVVSNVLSLSGYRVLEARDSATAMDLFQANRDGIDLLVTDVVLPGNLDGIQLSRRVLDTMPDLGVLFMSGYVQEALARSGSMPQGSRFISKPFSTREFLKTVSEMIGSGRSRSCGNG